MTDYNKAWDELKRFILLKQKESDKKKTDQNSNVLISEKDVYNKILSKMDELMGGN